MNAATDRGAVLGSILTASGCLSVPTLAGAGAWVADPVMGAVERHRRAYGAFMDVWSQTNVVALYDRANAEEGAAAALRELRGLRKRHSPPCSPPGRQRRPRQSPASSTSPSAAWRLTRCGLGPE